MPTFVVEVIELSPDGSGTKRKGAKIVDRVNDLEEDLKDVRSVERLACLNLEVLSTRVKTMKNQIKETVAKYAKMVDETAHSEKGLRVHTSSWESPLKAETGCVSKWLVTTLSLWVGPRSLML